MATKNIGVRVEEENVEKFNKVKGEFISASAFANWIIEAFDKEQQTKSADSFATEINAAAKAAEALMNSVKRMSTLAVDTVINKDIQIQTTLSNKDIQIKELEETVAAGDLALSEKENEFTSIIKLKDEELKTQIAETKELQKQLKESKELIEKIQAELITTQKLNSLLSKDQEQHKAIDAKNEELTKEVSSLKEQLLAAQKVSDESIRSLNDEKRASATLVKEHAKALEIATKEKDLAVAQAIAEATTKAQTELAAQLRNEEKTLRENSELKDVIAKLEKEKHKIVTSHEKQIDLLNKQITELQEIKTQK